MPGMDDEIEATQQHLRRSAALIQDAFEGLSTLNNRIAEPSALPVPPPSMHRRANSVGPVMEDGMSRRAMDPGHNIIVLSSSDTTSLPSTSTSTSPPSSSTTTRGTSSRRTRPSDSTLVSLRTELLASTQSVRERTNELEDLHRSIVQYAQERNSALAEITTPSTTETAHVARESGRSSRFQQGPSRRTLLDYTLPQRSTNESATSLGAMVAARSSSPSNSNSTMHTNVAAANPSPGSAFFVPTPMATVPAATATARSPPPAVPTAIASRVSRLAQEIQQDIARITQQSESLMAWINDHRVRLDAASTAVPSGMPTLSIPSEATARRTATSSDTFATQPVTQVSVSPDPTTSTSDVVSSITPRLSITSVPRLNNPGRPDPTTPTQRRRASERGSRSRELPNEGGTAPQLVPARPRRTPEAEDLGRYFRQSVPSGWGAVSSIPASPREDITNFWGSYAREDEQDGPLALPSRTIIPPSVSELRSAHVEAMNGLRSAIARAAQRGAEVGENDDVDNVFESRTYRVRRRYNADGDEEVVRVALRPELSPGLGDPSDDRTREETDDAEEEEEANEAWMHARSRLDTLLGELAAHGAATSSLSRWEPPPMERRGARAGATVNAETGASVLYPTNLARRSSRGWPRLNSRGDEMSTAEEEYERDLAAMRARARSLVSANAPPRTLSGTTLPPPPPTTRPLSFVPTTQGTPGSLWNDSSVRVRLRAAAARLDEDMRRALDNARERSYTPLAASRDAVPSPSPPLERPSRARHRGGAEIGNQGGDLERPMWGSPTPFYPSLLPLPLMEDMNSLEARSRAFVGGRKLARMPKRQVLAQAGR